ncbi:hypothetical protein SAMN02910292_02522 [Lachnospiraceae bacterium XBB2008]|nr:hypothetical protein SAMN02910292_02522 [Lachnospiraceae bacterium XBB2008]
MIKKQPAPGHESEYVKKAKTLPILHKSYYGEDRGILNGHSPKEVTEIYGCIDRCTCGGMPEIIEMDGMGDLMFEIRCSSCGRRIVMTDYDRKSKIPFEWEQTCINFWNKGLTERDVDKIFGRK